jgi:iron complex outermembrane receptor protein
MTRYSEIARLIRRALAVGAITAASGVVVVHAQEQTQAEQQPALQTVVVTGSVIKRTDFETPSPVQVMTSEDLQQSGYTSVSEVLRNLSANGQGTLSQSFNFAFAGGGSGVALRGLTVGGTLTLVDGSRMIPYPLSDDSQRNFVDVSAIPFYVVDSIEVLKDGASAEYGSDAIAGVVNVKLKRTYTGGSVTADFGTTQHKDGTTEHLAGIWGVGDLGADGYNAYLAVEWRHQDQIQVKNRSGFWTNLDWTPYGGLDTRLGANPLGAGVDASTSNFRPEIPGGYVLNPATNHFDPTTVFINTTACANFTAFQNDKCIWQDRDQIQPATGNINLLGRVTKNLGGDWQFVFTPSLFRSTAEQVSGGGNSGVSGSPRTSFGYGPGVPPFEVPTGRVLLPVGAPNNPFPAEARYIPFYPQQIGDPETQFVTDTYRLFGELRGTAAGWDLDATAGWMYAKLTQKYTGAINRGQLVTTAASGFNFASATADQMAAAFAPLAETTDTNTMEVVDLHGTRELFQLPGGPLSLALGGGYYHLYKNSPAAPTAAAGVQAINAAYVIGGQTNYNGYAEFVAPIIQGLEVDAAVRYDHYDTYGGSTTPKFGLKYSPFKMITLRGTYGKGFRAPNPAEAGNAAAAFGGLGTFNLALCPDPTNPQGPNSFPGECLESPGLQLSTKTLQPEKSTNWTLGLIFTPVDGTSISFDYWDIKINQDIQSGTSLFALGGDPSLFPIAYGPQQVEPFCTAQNVCNTEKLTPLPGPILYVAFPYYNLSQTHVNGLDVDLASHFGIGSAGRLTATFNGTYMFHYIFGFPGQSFDLAGTHGPSIVSGDTGNPKIRAVASVAWDKGPLNVTASLNYVGRFNLTDPTAFEPDCVTAMSVGGIFGGRGNYANNAYLQSKYCEVASFTDVDLYMQYAFTKSLSIHGSILNVFDTPPPLDMTTYGDPGNIPYNPAMHQAGAVGRFFNIGATYTW